MNKVPFKNFIITLLFCGKTINDIIDKLKSFNYDITEDEILLISNELKSTLPKSVIDILNNRLLLNLENNIHVEWLKKLNIFELYHYITSNNKNNSDVPNYFKWCEDCVWIHSYYDVMSIVNIFIFNNEPLENISDIIMLKYKKKIGIDALNLYKKIFWDTENLTAKDALRYCIPFHDNTLIIRKFNNNTEIECPSNDGSDVTVNFHNINYIKWKLGIPITTPNTDDFLKQVQTDSIYKFYEVMNSTQSIEEIKEEGQNDKFGVFDSTKTTKRNVEEMRVKLAKQWLDIFIKVKEHTGASDQDSTTKFFNQMKQVQLEFDNCEEHITKIDDIPNLFENIKGDI